MLPHELTPQQRLQSCMRRRDAYTLDMLEIPQGAGSGLIWDLSGHIVTNYHVIRGASELQVLSSPQSSLPDSVPPPSLF